MAIAYGLAELDADDLFAIEAVREQYIRFHIARS